MILSSYVPEILAEFDFRPGIDQELNESGEDFICMPDGWIISSSGDVNAGDSRWEKGQDIQQWIGWMAKPKNKTTSFRIEGARRINIWDCFEGCEACERSTGNDAEKGVSDAFWMNAAHEPIQKHQLVTS